MLRCRSYPWRHCRALPSDGRPFRRLRVGPVRRPRRHRVGRNHQRHRQLPRSACRHLLGCARVGGTQPGFWRAETAPSGWPTTGRSIASGTGRSHPSAGAMVFRGTKSPPCSNTAPAICRSESTTGCISSKMGDNRLPEPDGQPLGMVVGLTEDVDGNLWAVCASRPRDWCAFAIFGSATCSRTRRSRLDPTRARTHTGGFGSRRQQEIWSLRATAR